MYMVLELYQLVCTNENIKYTDLKSPRNRDPRIFLGRLWYLCVFAQTCHARLLAGLSIKRLATETRQLHDALPEPAVAVVLSALSISMPRTRPFVKVTRPIWMLRAHPKWTRGCNLQLLRIRIRRRFWRTTATGDVLGRRAEMLCGHKRAAAYAPK